MKKKYELPYENIIKFNKNDKYPNLYDLELSNINKVKKFHSFECHVVLYPFCRKISADNFKFNPYEEYVKDISSNQKSAYNSIGSRMNGFFGIFLGVIIFLLFYFFNKTALFSVESVISILGAYFLGKDLWGDIEKFLIFITKKFPVKFVDNPYSYEILNSTTLSKYSFMAKRIRYNKETVLPEKMDLIEQSNSQTVRMKFGKNSLKEIIDDHAHILSIHIDSPMVQDFERYGYMLGIKLSFNKKFFIFLKNYELFQSIVRKKKGCIDMKNNWINNSVFFRKALSVFRIKLFLSNKIIENTSLIEVTGLKINKKKN